MNIGDVFETNGCGELVVVDYRGWDSVDVKFLGTGYKATCRAGNIERGKVRDPLFRSYKGVGFKGVGKHKAINGNPAYIKWYSMLDRCYGELYQRRQHTYIGCTVCEDWHNFQNFADWFVDNYPDDGLAYDLDKDAIVSGNSIYSPSTCSFVSDRVNTQLAHAKTGARLESPDGVVFEVETSIRDFAKKHGLCHRGVTSLIAGKIKCGKHKGWKLSQT